MKYLSDYQAPQLVINNVELHFDIYDGHTTVTNKMSCVPNSSCKKNVQYFLEGQRLKLISFKLDGENLSSELIEVNDLGLYFKSDKDCFELEIVTEIYPETNHALDGLYKSGDVYCTQNEAEGFRKITYFQDRPDSLSLFKTKITADKKYSYLLSNGNCIAKGQLTDQRHWAVWEDPFPKPCYLYALVVGNFDVLRDHFVTKSGRSVGLEIYIGHGLASNCAHAMNSLKQAMRWDEEVYALEYDLDVFMIVGVDSFNMGAMENKGLNIFNSKFILGDQVSATDTDLEWIQGIVGHEYFHNWSGNRVTCRDWFQLTLKEGLTVFRDQQFSADMNSVEVKRISDVQHLKASQFVEDSGAFSHPIKPDRYEEINNFYTATVYEKGAEVIRMIYVILGKDLFYKGIAHYFKTFDGQAVTTEDFIASFEQVSEFDFSNFKLWYSVAGTPTLKVEQTYNEETKKFKLNIKQENNISPNAKPQTIPLLFAFFDRQGNKIENNVSISGSELSVLNPKMMQQQLLVLQDREISLEGTMPVRPVLSINRGFSAPIQFKKTAKVDDLLVLSQYDDDSYNRWDAVQHIFTYNISLLKKDKTLKRADESLSIIDKLLSHKNLNPHFLAYCLNLPHESSLQEECEHYDFEATYDAYHALKKMIAHKFKSHFFDLYHQLSADQLDQWNDETMGKRFLRNTCLDYLCSLGDHEIKDIVYKQFNESKDMTSCIFALSLINEHQFERVEQYNLEFEKKWQTHPANLDRLVSIKMMINSDKVFKHIDSILSSSYFDLTIPNKVRALYQAFATKNTLQFNRLDGKGYELLAEAIIKTDKINPQTAARLTKCFKDPRKLDEVRRKNLSEQLGRIKEQEKLSQDTAEIVSKILKII